MSRGINGDGENIGKKGKGKRERKKIIEGREGEKVCINRKDRKERKEGC